METRAAIDRFLASPGLSEATRRAYRFDLEPFADWLEARKLCEKLSASQVYEYLRGEREIGVPAAEAMLAALELEVGPRFPVRAYVPVSRPAGRGSKRAAKEG